MTEATLERLIACQDDLMRAIVARDVDAIHQASQALAEAVEQQRSVSSRVESKDRIEYAMKQSTALAIRVNTLSDWNRQRIDRLAELRGESPGQTYSRTPKI